MRPGPLNLITDVAGLKVGHAADGRAQGGVTVVLCPGCWTAAADVRGGAGARGLLWGLDNTAGRVHAIVLCGGAMHGLAAADGVTGSGEGSRTSDTGSVAPIAPAAVLFDLANGGDKAWDLEPPYRRLGVEAAQAACEGGFALGRVGAGRRAMAGAHQSGLGSASLDLGGGVIVGALAAVNPLGSPYMADGATPWAWPFEIDGEFGGRRPAPKARPHVEPLTEAAHLRHADRAETGADTTLAVVAVSAGLSGPDCKRVAIMAHDGVARAIRPAHTTFDGDIVFVVANGEPLGEPRHAEVARIGSAAADVLARAIARAVWASKD